MKKVVLSAAVCAMAFSANAEAPVVSSESSAFSCLYAGLGVGGSFLETTDMDYWDGNSNHRGHHCTVKSNRVVGSVVLGGSKVFRNDVYVGGEVLLDITKKKKTEIFAANGTHVADYDMKGFFPQIDAKVGCAFGNSLAYGKFGLAWSRVSAHSVSGDKNYSKTKPGFVLGLGAEKAFCNKFSAALEGDYNFGFKWQDEVATHNREFTCNKGWTVRALVKHNVKY